MKELKTLKLQCELLIITLEAASGKTLRELDPAAFKELQEAIKSDDDLELRRAFLNLCQLADDLDVKMREG